MLRGYRRSCVRVCLEKMPGNALSTGILKHRSINSCTFSRVSGRVFSHVLAAHLSIINTRVVLKRDLAVRRMRIEYFRRAYGHRRVVRMILRGHI
jgi:hypothetical protein